jgi:hypothetical protein
MKGVRSMWLIVFAFLTINVAAYSASPVDLELLFNNGLQKFVASEPNISKTANRNDCTNSLPLDENERFEEEDAWPEVSED